MIAMERWMAALIAITTVAWVVLFVRALILRDRQSSALSFNEIGLLAMTALLAMLWTAAAPPWSFGISRSTPEVELAQGCRGIRETLPGAKVRALLGEPQRKVLEDDIRGPGAMAWIYDDRRCIVHLMNDRVVAFDEE